MIESSPLRKVEVQAVIGIDLATEKGDFINSSYWIIFGVGLKIKDL